MLSPFSDFITFFANTGRLFLPAALTGALVLSLWRGSRVRQQRRELLAWACLAAGLLIGAAAADTAAGLQTFTQTETVLVLPLFGAALLAIACSFLVGERSGSFGFWASMPLVILAAAKGAFHFLAFVHDKALSATSVVNSGFIIKIGGVLTALSALAALAVLLTRFGRRLSLAWARTLLGGLLLLVGLQWLATLLINLIRLEQLQATPALISFVAKVQDLFPVWVYLLLLFSLLVWGLFLRRRHRGLQGEHRGLPEPERRKLRALRRIDLRRIMLAVTLVLGLSAGQGWYDLVTSRPPSLSEATPVTPGEQGMVRIATEGLKDGHLHRYSYVTSDGYRVRFFIIQRYEGSNTFGVVYDACELCADTGYIEKNRNIICLACNVSIFIPSIGKAGGCNPIPMVHETEGDAIVISRRELESAASLFTERVEIMAEDPVSHARVSNLKARYRFTVDGFTYYFESADTLETFKKAPHRYIDRAESI